MPNGCTAISVWGSDFYFSDYETTEPQVKVDLLIFWYFHLMGTLIHTYKQKCGQFVEAVGTPTLTLTQVGCQSWSCTHVFCSELWKNENMRNASAFLVARCCACVHLDSKLTISEDPLWVGKLHDIISLRCL